MTTRANRRREATAQAKAIAQGIKDQELLNATRQAAGEPTAPAVNVTLADVQTVLNANPQFRQLVVNAALLRELAEARAALAEQAAGKKK